MARNTQPRKEAANVTHEGRTKQVLRVWRDHHGRVAGGQLGARRAQRGAGSCVPGPAEAAPATRSWREAGLRSSEPSSAGWPGTRSIRPCRAGRARRDLECRSGVVIGNPINDVTCLARITDAAAEAVDTDPVRNLAMRFESMPELAAWIRSLPQRNDMGDPDDGPRVACPDVSQRVRIPAADPNCVERSALYLAAGEIIDPRPLRQLATIHTPIGPHTFPVETTHRSSSIRASRGTPSKPVCSA